MNNANIINFTSSQIHSLSDIMEEHNVCLDFMGSDYEVAKMLNDVILEALRDLDKDQLDSKQMKPTDLKCYKQVAAVIGEAYADYELQRVIDCKECQTNHRHDIKGNVLEDAFIWNKSPLDAEFWYLINKDKNPYEHGHEKPELNVPEFEHGDNVTAASILKAGLGHMQDRAVTYDKPQGERSMGKTVDMFNVLYGLELTEEQGWAFMTILKLVRTSQGDLKLDNFEDMAAYAGLMGEAADKLAQSDK